MEKPVENTTCVVVEDNNKILLVKRKNDTFFGFWCLPGGHSEEGEKQHQGAQREANEEIGDVKVEEKPFFSLVHDWPTDSHINRPHLHNCSVFRAHVTGKLEANDDAGEIGWFTLEEARKLQITNYTRAVLENIS